MNFLFAYQWELFILAEILSVASLLLFGVVRYVIGKRKMSLLFLLLFLVFWKVHLLS